MNEFRYTTKWLVLIAAWGFVITMQATSPLELAVLRVDPPNFTYGTCQREHHYTVQASHDLRKWLVVAEYEGNGGNHQFTDCRSKQDRQFYRVLVKNSSNKQGMFDREWLLAAIHKKGQDPLRPKKGRRHSIKLARNMRLDGRNDCNSISGGFSIKDGNCLKIGPILSTRMLCQQGSIDFQFSSALLAAKGYEVGENRFRIYFGEQSENWMDFEESN